MDRYSIWERVGIWFVGTTCTPVLFIVLAWVIGKYVVGSDHPAYETFGTGDLLPLAALLLLGVGADIFASQATSGSFLVHLMIFGLAILVMAVLYGAVKSKGIQNLQQGGDASLCQLKNFCLLSFAGVGYAVMHSTVAKIQLERRIARSIYG